MRAEDSSATVVSEVRLRRRCIALGDDCARRESTRRENAHDGGVENDGTHASLVADSVDDALPKCGADGGRAAVEEILDGVQHATDVLQEANVEGTQRKWRLNADGRRERETHEEREPDGQWQDFYGLHPCWGTHALFHWCSRSPYRPIRVRRPTMRSTPASEISCSTGTR